MSDYFTECDVRVYRDKKCVLVLGLGINSVISFCHLVDGGKIKGTLHVDREFNCNADVDIKGEQLIPFLQAYYPDADTSQILSNEIYAISSYDLS